MHRIKTNKTKKHNRENEKERQHGIHQKDPSAYGYLKHYFDIIV
jgi:hypothetical protein